MALTWVKIANLRGPAGDAAALNKFAAIEAKNTEQDSRLASAEEKTSAQGAELQRTVREGDIRLGLLSDGNPEILFAVIDNHGLLTDLTVRLSDGQLPDWVVDRLAPRIAERINTASGAGLRYDIQAGTLYALDINTGLRSPVLTDFMRMAGFGSSTMQAMRLELDSLAAAHGMTYFDGGKGGEIAEQTLARLGTRPALIDATTIPASGPIVVTAPNMATSANSGATVTGTLAGVPGTLVNEAGGGTAFTFTRTSPGEAVPVPSGTPMRPEHGAEGATLHLNLGKNNFANLGGTSDPAQILTWTSATVRAWAGGNALVWGHFIDRDTPDVSVVRDRVNAYNIAARAAYGSRFFDLGAFIASPEVWAYSGVTPTADDLAHQARGNKPPSLSSDSLHLNAAGNSAVRRKVAEQLSGLKWIGA